MILGVNWRDLYQKCKDRYWEFKKELNNTNRQGCKYEEERERERETEQEREREREGDLFVACLL